MPQIDYLTDLFRTDVIRYVFMYRSWIDTCLSYKRICREGIFTCLTKAIMLRKKNDKYAPKVSHYGSLTF